MADDNLERITILLQARDKDFHRAMDRNNKLIAKFSKDAEKSTSRATQGINKALDGAAGKMGSFAKTFAVGLVGGAVGQRSRCCRITSARPSRALPRSAMRPSARLSA